MTTTAYRVLAALYVVVSSAMPAAAGAAEKQVVYWPLVFDGGEYRRVPYPREAGPVVVLAGTEIVIEARRATVSYWPITREYHADIGSRSSPVQAEVEIVAADGSVQNIEPQSYLVWHENGVGAGPGKIVSGEHAVDFYADYVGEARAAAEATKSYQRTIGFYQAAVEAWLKVAAERPAVLPPPPPEPSIKAPKRYLAFATEPTKAAIVVLEEGEVTIRLRAPDGTVVPGSTRQLISLAPTSHDTGYVIRQENRWTQPIVSFNPREAIYISGSSALFLEPVPVVEYRAETYIKLFHPQSVATYAAATIWVKDPSRQGRRGAEASVSLEGSGTDKVSPIIGYRVTQTAGAALGFLIAPFEEEPNTDLYPDFYAAQVPGDGTVTGIALTDPIAGAGSTFGDRRIRLIEPPATLLLFLPALLPLFVGAGLRLSDRWARSSGKGRDHGKYHDFAATHG